MRDVPAYSAATQSYGEYTLPQLLARQAELYGSGRAAIREKAYGIWHSYSWQEYYQFVKKSALGLIAAGLTRGERLGLIVNNHPEWLFSELGGQAAGAVTVNMFTSAVSEELSAVLCRIGASIVIVQDQEQVDKLLERRDKLSHVRKVIYIDQTGMRTYEKEPWLISFQKLLEMGDILDAQQPDLFSRELMRGKPDDIALMILTSGTTGISKLAMMSHDNFTGMAQSWMKLFKFNGAENWLSISPPAWIVDQMWGVGVALAGGMTMNFPEMQETSKTNFRELGPGVIITSSRFWEDLASSIRVRMSDAGYIKKKLFAIAEKIGTSVVAGQSKGLAVPSYLRALHRLSIAAVFKPLLDRVGCAKLVHAYTGGHPISPDVIRFFRALGLNLKQCYGLTESSGIFQVQPDDEVMAETVGKPLPGIMVRISDDQEVLVSSDTVFRGYYNDLEATEKAFEEGWLKTGDAGYIDERGHLVIIGRKEEIIRNKRGDAFSPDFIETRLKFSPYIKEAVVFGEARPYITALINIDLGNVGNWAEERMIPYTTYTDLSQQGGVEALISEEIRNVNERLPDFMKIKKIILLYKLLDADDEELTRTGKVRRRFVYGLYIKLIEAMYTTEREVDVKATVRYRDGQTNTLETKVKILSLS
ncbi:MAG: AMP-binding protein [Deltaproteobacteria bacterium]|nr:AMP-binding protein [Deltaproteobacteria bacterium]